MAVVLNVSVERWPIAGAFTISRGSKTEAEVVVAELHDGAVTGRGECTPYGRYGESVEAVVATIAALAADVSTGLDRAGLQRALPPGAARNALDCAFIDLEAKRAGRAAERIAAVRSAAPHAELIVDANEGWRAENLKANFAACAAAGVTLIEQPLPADADAALAAIARTIPVCADESVHDRASLASLKGKYDAVNIKLDKAGGLTEALALAAAAQAMGFAIMVGCMVSTSLAIAPAMLLAGCARWVDLDGPLLLARDRPGGLRFDGSLVYPPVREFWG
jgi:L-alanine-DL-glutamate epimerase-like enolase superfamily enzyme